MKNLLFAAGALGLGALAWGQVSLTTLGSTYYQDFNALDTSRTVQSSTLPTGWALYETGTNANTTYLGDPGSNTAGNTYSYGTNASTDRAFGGLLSGSLTPTFGAGFTNNTGGAITSLDIAYVGEQWRLGTRNRFDSLKLQFSTDATSLSTGSWTSYPDLSFQTKDTSGAAGARDGNNASFRSLITGSITGLNIANGATFWLRWVDFNASGADDGLAVDSFNLTPQGGVVSSSSDIAAAGSCSTNIRCVDFQAIDITEANALKAWSFKVRDGGGSADADANPTIVDSIKLVKGAQDGVASWGGTIRRAALYSGGVERAEVAVTGDTIKFGGLNFTVADDADSTLALYLSFETAYTDNQQFQFKVSNSLVKTAGASSAFAAFACSSRVANDTNRIEVAATALNFSTQPPASVGANADFGAGVEAADANGNRDLDAIHSVTLARASGSGALTSVAGLTQGLAAGLGAWSDLRYDAVESGVTIAASAAGLVVDTSSAITVTGEVGSATAAGDSAEPAAISSLLDSQGEAVLNFDFTVSDDGSIPGTDALPTLIDTITILQGTGNDPGTWYNVIAGAVLLDQAGNSFSGAIGATTIRFNNIPTTAGALGYVADNATKHYRLKCWLKSDLTYLRDTIDGLNLAFRVNRSSYRTLAAGSSAFAAGNGTNVESGADNNMVSVAGTALNFSYHPQPPVYRSASFRVDVEAVDSNGNRDRGATDAVTLSRAAGAGALTSAAGLTQSLVAGLRSWNDLQYDVSETGVRIRAAAGGLATDTCDAFAVVETEPATQASGLAFSAVGETQMTVSWTSGSGAGRILLAKAGQTVSHPPVDGEGYTASSFFGVGSQIGTNNFAIYAGSGNSVTVIGLSPLTRYFFAVYEYNGAGATANYLTALPDTGSQMTNASLSVGDFQSKLDGNWSSMATWDQWNGGSWVAAAALPTSSSTVYLSGGDTVTVDASGACKNLIMYNAGNGMRLTLNAACTLSVAGTLSSADNLPSAALIKGEGLVRFTGGSRALFGSTWAANPPGWRFEVSLDPGAVGTTSSGIKAGQITVSSGTFVVGTSPNNDLRPDSGAAGTGSVRVANGATLTVLGSISRTSTATAPCALVDVNGVLRLAGRNISATNININNSGKLVSTRTDIPRGHLITGTLTYTSGATLEYSSGTTDLGQATGGELTATVHNLTVNNAAGDTLKSSVTVNGTLRCQQGRLFTGAYTATLASDALLVESDAANVQGTVQITRTLAQSVADTFNGLGLTVTASGAAPGATTVVRTTGRHYGVGGNQGIDRSVSVSPAVNSGLNATMVLRYRDAELNGLVESELGLFRSANNGASWDSMGGTVDPGANTITLPGIGAFSLWTAGKSGVPLSVQLSAFTAAAAGGGVTLRWRTESECGTYRWAIERSGMAGGPYREIDRIPAQGTSCAPHEYVWSDRDVAPGAYWYRLVECDLDGTRSVHGPVSCIVPGAGGALTLHCRPNPFSTSTTIAYQVPAAGPVRIAVYNAAGQRVWLLNDGSGPTGSGTITWGGTDDMGRRLANGAYIVRIETYARSIQQKLLLVR